MGDQFALVRPDAVHDPAEFHECSGPFVAVLLADEKWTQQDIGFALSLGGFAGLLSQLPGGEMLDATRSKRFLIALGGIMVAVSAFVMALWPNRAAASVALVLQGLTGGLLGPAIAAISLGLVGLAEMDRPCAQLASPYDLMEHTCCP